MTKIVSEKLVKDLKLVKVAVASSYWRFWRPFNEAFFQQSQTNPGMTVNNRLPAVILNAAVL